MPFTNADALPNKTPVAAPAADTSAPSSLTAGVPRTASSGDAARDATRPCARTDSSISSTRRRNSGRSTGKLAAARRFSALNGRAISRHRVSNGRATYLRRRSVNAARHRRTLRNAVASHAHFAYACIASHSLTPRTATLSPRDSCCKAYVLLRARQRLSCVVVHPCNATGHLYCLSGVRALKEARTLAVVCARHARLRCAMPFHVCDIHTYILHIHTSINR